MEKIFSLHRYSEAYKVKFIINAFRLDANSWWKDLSRRMQRDGEEPIETWRELKRALRKQFVKRSYTKKLRTQLQEMRQGTRSVHDYYFELISLRNKLQIDETDEAMETRFIHGLNKSIRDPVELYSLKCGDLEELVEYAETIEDHQKDRGATSSSRKPYAIVPALVPRQGGSAPKISAPTPAPQTPTRPRDSPKVGNPRAPPPLTAKGKQVSTSDQGKRTPVQCFKCKGWGHYATECINQRTMHIAENGEVFSDGDIEYVEKLQEPEKEAKEAYDPDIEFSSEDEHFETLVVRRSLSTPPHKEEPSYAEQRSTIFHMKCKAQGKTCLVIIDSGSCTNLVSEEFVKELALKPSKHPHPYVLQWIGENGAARVRGQVKVPLKIGELENEVLCDIVPMNACQILLGRPWEFDMKAIHDGYSNEYTIRANGTCLKIPPLSLKSIQEAHHHLQRKRDIAKQKESELKKPMKASPKSKVPQQSKEEPLTSKKSESFKPMCLVTTGKYDICPTFNVSNLNLFVPTGKADSMKSPFQGGGDDVNLKTRFPSFC